MNTLPTKISILLPREKWMFFIAIIMLYGSLFWDDNILQWAGDIRIYPLDAFMLFMTDFGLLYFALLLIAFLILKKKYKEIVLIAFTGAFALEISYLSKMIFQTPRPFAAAIVATIPLTQASGLSMPSLHTAVCFSLWPYMPRIFGNKKPLLILGYILIILIALSRLYLGVHYFSDLIAGGLIGYFLAKTWLYYDEKFKIIRWVLFHIRDKLELRRQIAHLLTGCAIVLLLKLQLINAEFLFMILVVGGIISLLERKYRLPLIDRILRYFERPHDLKIFPGKGSFFLILGALITLLLFKGDIALAAISIMAVGDAITTIVGTYFGRLSNPLNPKKHLEGTGIAIIFSTLAAFFFVDFEKAIMASIVAMIAESLYVPYLSDVLDDNLFIPLVAGVVMVLV